MTFDGGRAGRCRPEAGKPALRNDICAVRGRDRALMNELGALTVHSLRDGDMHVIELTGELDIAGVPAVERELKLAEASAARMVVLDVRRLGFIDASGVRVLVLAHRRQRGRLAVVKGSRGVQRAFEICGVTKLLPFVDEAPRA